MLSLHPRWNGLVFGMLFAPLVGLVTYLTVFFVALLSLTRLSVFETLYRAISFVWHGNPLYWAVTMMVVHVVACTVWGFLSCVAPTADKSVDRSVLDPSGASSHGVS